MAGKNNNLILVRGIDKVIKQDLKKHKDLLTRSQNELIAYKESVSYLIQRKKHYSGLVGNGEYNDNSLRESVVSINVDIKGMSDKVKLTEDAISHHSLIVETLTKQLEDHYEALAGR